MINAAESFCCVYLHFPHKYGMIREKYNDLERRIMGCEYDAV